MNIRPVIQNIAINETESRLRVGIAQLREDNERLRKRSAILSQLEEGELGADDHDALTRSTGLGAAMMVEVALMLEGMGRNSERRKRVEDAAALKRVASLLRGEAGRSRDVNHRIYEQGNVYIHPEG